MTQGSLRKRWAAVWPMGLLCLLGSSRWLLESAYPNARSTDLTASSGCLLAAGCMVLAGLALRRGRVLFAWRGTDPKFFWGAVAVLTGPAIASFVSIRHISGENATLALSVTPVVVAVATSAWGNTRDGDMTARLWPGLAGIAALLLLLPQPSLSNWRFVLALAFMPLVVGLGGAATSEGSNELHAPEFRSEKPYLPWQPAALALASALFAGLALRARLEGADLPWSFPAMVLDGLSMFLTLQVLRGLGAVRWSSQFLLIPLLTLVQGAILLRPALDLRFSVGFALLGVSSGYLLLVG